MQLHTTTTGDGERHVGLVHGLGGDGDTWRPLVDRMLETGRYTVTTVDLRGHGHSGRASSYGLDEFATDLVEALPTGLHSVVGHSLGGAVLVRAVARLQPLRATLRRSSLWPTSTSRADTSKTPSCACSTCSPGSTPMARM